MYVYILGFALFTIILLTSVYFIYKAIKQKYTKSRFAFIAFTSLSSVVSLIVISLLSGHTPTQGLTVLASKIFGFNYVPSQPNLIEIVALCFVTWLLYSLSKSIFTHWEGPITVEQHKKLVRREDVGFIVDGFKELKRIIEKAPEEEIYIKEDIKSADFKLKTPEHSMAWHMQACELVCLARSDLFFNIHDGWVESEACWHGVSKREQTPVILYCYLNDPTEIEVQSIAKGAQDFSKSHSISIGDVAIVVAIKADCISRDINVSGIQIKTFSEKSLLDRLVDFQDYYYEICKRVEKDALPESTLTINDTYVESDYTREGDSENKINTNLEAYLLEWLTDTSRRQIALLGEYGQGKSTLSLMFAYHIINKQFDNVNYIPILIELRGKSPATMTPDEVLSSWSVNYQIKSSALKKLLISGRILLIFEGFDEMAFLGDAETRISHFKTLWLLNYPNTKILITGRPNFFLDDREMKSALGVLDPVVGKAYCEALHLVPFDIDKITSSLRKFPNKTRTEVTQFVKSNENFKDLASRPSILYLIGVLWDRKNLSQYGENINSALIIGLFIAYCYSRQHSKQSDSRTFMLLNENERSYFMNGVAVFMAAHWLQNQIKNTDLRDIVIKLLEVIPAEVSTNCSPLNGERKNSLRERINNEEDKIEQLQTDIRSCGLLVRDISSSGTLKFSHKSFMEYLAAEVASKYTNGFDESASILTGLGSSVLDVLDTPEIVSFFAELLNNTYREAASTKEGLALYMLQKIAGNRGLFSLKPLIRLMVITEDKKSPFMPFKIIQTLPLIGFLPFILLAQGGRNFRKLTIWEHCCSHLEISVDEMAKCFGKGAASLFQRRRDKGTGNTLHYLDLNLPPDSISIVSFLLRNKLF